jgi:protein associated with RNAse G/E
MQRSGNTPILKVDGDRVIYVNAQNYTIHYRNGKKTIMDYKNNFGHYKMTDNFIITTENDILSVVEGEEKKTISLTKNTLFAFGENILGFVDWDGRLKVYEGADILDLEALDIVQLKAADRAIAWTDDSSQFMFWSYGKLQEIGLEYPISFSVGNDFVVFVDEYSSLKVFYDGTTMDLEDYEPSSYKVGDDFFAYINDQGDFKVFADGELRTFDVEPPKNYQVKENTMYYVDSRSFFKVFDQGKVHDLETYPPQKILMDEGVVAYTDLDGYLWAYYEGEKVKVSTEIVNDFEVQGRVITYWNNSLNAEIYWDGQRY